MIRANAKMGQKVESQNVQDFLNFLNKERLHHAYLVLASTDLKAGHSLIDKISEFFEKNFNFSKKNNTDFLIFSYDSLGIEDGRAINELQSKRSVHPSGKKVFIIQANSITREAQNSLLKMFEEPSSGSHFFLILPRQGLILPTLLSRLQVVDLGLNLSAGKGSDRESDDVYGFANDLLSTPVYKRLAKVGKFLDTEPSKDDLYKILDIFENNLHKNLSKQTGKAGTGMTVTTEDLAWRLEQLLKLKSYLGDRSASIKMIIESASLLP